MAGDCWLRWRRKNFLKSFLKLTGGIPSAKTYERVISIVDSNELNNIFVEFIKEIQFMDNKYFKDILSFDGKVDKRNKGYITEETKPLNVLNVYSDKLEMCIEQEMIEEKKWNNSNTRNNKKTKFKECKMYKITLMKID